MSEKISRRDFLKISGLGMTAAAVMTGCGPSSRYVVRQAYANMPEYNQTGESTFYATTCQECPAGCGLIVRTQEGRAIKVEGNPNHPVNQGKICSRGLTSVQGLYNPDRIASPQKRTRNSRDFTPMSWDDALTTVANSMSNPTKTAFLLGLQSDHLYDLVTEITTAANTTAPYRYGSLAAIDGQKTLLSACAEMFGSAQFPYFDISNADVILSFGANFLEQWLSPVAYSRGYRNMRKQEFGKRGFLVSLEARQSLTSANADLWLPVIPGSEGYAALAIGKLAAQLRNSSVPGMYAGINVSEAANICGVDEKKLIQVAEIVAAAEKPIALAGAAALTHSGGLEAAKAILGINAIVNNLGQPGGVFFAPGFLKLETIPEINNLIQQMNAGEIETLLIHGVNPLFELPKSLGFTEALQKVKNVISFASFEDETAIASDYVFPDHTALESFGYQRILAGSDRETYSSIQPVVQPVYDTKATADVLLAALAAAGGDLSKQINYSDEVDFLQQKITPFISAGGFYSATELPTFWSKWLQYGGWWKQGQDLNSPAPLKPLTTELTLAPIVPLEDQNTFHLVTFTTQMGDGRGANRPWLQETPDPMTTATWNSWIEINPQTADVLGVDNDDIVTITSSQNNESIEAIVYRYPAIRPDCVAIPFGQGHTALGRYAEGRGCNPAQVWGNTFNSAGDLNIAETQVKITPTGRKHTLARQESKAGVYGEH